MSPTLKFLVLALLPCFVYANVMADDLLIIDDRGTGDYRSALGTSWRLVTDGVMGGVSSGQLTLDTIDGRACLRLRGDVRLDNSGGFVQAALDVKGANALDASGYRGVLLEVYGNAEEYNVHLRTEDVWLPWQSWRASFEALAGWHSVRLPFAEFTGYRIGSPLSLGHLERIGIVAIGRAFKADLCVARLALYRDATP
jgi:Complex I intermediate-associated protein 30 (CIA30)